MSSGVRRHHGHAAGRRPLLDRQAARRIERLCNGIHSNVIGLILSLIVIGFIAGLLARLLVPGRDSMSVWQTLWLGIVGSFIGGFLAFALSTATPTTDGSSPRA
jgi:uncharacterized membrane protein YeaQ/YmgE (transglycosylase-associated protein family)